MPIRPAQPRDAAEIARIHVRTWQVAYRGQVPDAYLKSLDAEIEERTARWERIIASPASRRQHQLLALDGDRIVGFVTFGPSNDESDPEVGEVYAIYVDPGSWDRGFGRELFAAAVQGLTDAGFRAATLWVLNTNARARPPLLRDGRVGRRRSDEDGTAWRRGASRGALSITAAREGSLALS